ncbi:MAG TPA: histone deacetylase family protein [Acetobacteraceae bacterium]|jgi:acetoin utilization deacetylase AcuC-like enzyme|nr:histone deacetylase family protein [Acetobacteraceae bacterium]
MKAFWNPVELAHAPQFFLQRGVVKRNFEVPGRAEALLAACRAMKLAVEKPQAAPRSALLEVHPAAYLDFLRDGPAIWAAAEGAGPEMVANVHPCPEALANGARLPDAITGQLGWYTADTACPITAETWPAAEAAAACAIAAADEVAEGRHAYALTRPPGHHAYGARAGGHCYLNNAALAAERLRMRGAGRVGILDIDSHHGNGTQGIFWRRDDVVFASVHGDPHGYYPWFVGHAGERGEGAGAGCNLNLPLARGSGDGDWTIAIATGLRLIEETGCDALVVSLGFDASVDEPLGYLAVTADGFARAGEMIGKSGLDCALIQEGGYNTEVIGGLLTRFIEGLEA